MKMVHMKLTCRKNDQNKTHVNMKRKKNKARAKASVAFVAKRAMIRHSAHKWCVSMTVFNSWRNMFAVPREPRQRCRCKAMERMAGMEPCQLEQSV